MTVLTLEQILAVDDRKPVAVDVPEWGGTVNVYPLTADELEDVERWNDDNPAGVGFRYKLLSLALADYGASEDQLRGMGKKNAAVIRRLALKASELIEPDYRAEVGNLDAAQTGGDG